MKKMISLMVALMMVLFSVSAMAETAALKAATSPDYPPFESLDDAGNVIGFDADLTAAIAKLIGQDITFEATSFVHLYSYLNNQHNAMRSLCYNPVCLE